MFYPLTNRLERNAVGNRNQIRQVWNNPAPSWIWVSSQKIKQLFFRSSLTFAPTWSWQESGLLKVQWALQFQRKSTNIGKFFKQKIPKLHMNSFDLQMKSSKKCLESVKETLKFNIWDEYQRISLQKALFGVLSVVFSVLRYDLLVFKN